MKKIKQEISKCEETRGSDIIEAIKGKMSKYKEIWESNITGSWESRFWKAVALSYIEQDVELERQRIFVTQISFYPNLIKSLISILNNVKKEFACKISLDITFFSTLLPRHYWNFPLEYKDQDNVCIDAPDFLDTYRESIKDYVNTGADISINIERILVIAVGSTRNVDGNTILFCEKDLNRDKQYLIPDPAVGKKSFSHFIEQNKSYRDQYLIDIDDLGRTTDLYKKRKNEKSQIYLLENKSKKQIQRNTLYDYYIKKLHSTGGARKLIVCDESWEDRCKKGSGYCVEKQFDSVSPNLSVIKIKIENDVLEDEKKEFEYALDTYMDLKMGIVKLQICDLKENIELKKHISELYNQSKKLRDNTKDVITDQNNLENLLDAIYIYGVERGRDTLQPLIKEVTDKLNRNLSQDTLVKVLTLSKGKKMTFDLLTQINAALCG